MAGAFQMLQKRQTWKTPCQMKRQCPGLECTLMWLSFCGKHFLMKTNLTKICAMKN